ncbi:MAG: NusG domain II-containing protein [Acutalibacteraceae bacterium]
MKKQSEKNLFKRTDIIIIFLISMLSLILFVCFKGNSDGVRTAVITVDGKVYETINLETANDRVFTIKTTPLTTIKIEDGSIAFINAECPDHTCEKTGFLKNTGDTAACIPAKVVISVKGEHKSSDNVDAVVG